METEGLTPVEQDRRDAIAAMTAGEKQRATWFAGVRRILDIAEPHPLLGRPSVAGGWIAFTIPGTGAEARRCMAAAETLLAAALHASFTGRPDESGYYYVLEAPLPGGLKVQVRAWREAVAEEHVTCTCGGGTEWVRLPADEPVPAAAGTGAA